MQKQQVRLICACGHRWVADWPDGVGPCPRCGACPHLWERRKGDCEWCFDGAEYCLICAAAEQQHAEFCPKATHEAYEFLGIISLRAWAQAVRNRPFEAAQAGGFHLHQIDRRRFEQAVWVPKDNPSARAAAEALIAAEEAAWVTERRIT